MRTDAAASLRERVGLPSLEASPSWPCFGLMLAAVASSLACRSSSGDRAAPPAPSAAEITCVNGEPSDVCAASCDAGDLQSCELLAAAILRGRLGAADDARAANLDQRACEGGRPSACVSLGFMYFEGKGRPQDEARAWDLMSAACPRDPGGCGEFGNLYAFGVGVQKNAARGARLLTLACDLDDGALCEDLAILVAHGDGVPEDLARAASLRQKACALGHTKSCVALGLPRPRLPKQPGSREDAGGE